MNNIVKQYIDLFKLKKVPDGTIYEVETTGKHYIRNGHNWDEMTKTKIKEGAGPSISLYELNQNSIINLPLITLEKLQNFIPQLNDWSLENLENNHFMLLSNRYNYYTIFEGDKIDHNHSFGEAVIDCIRAFPKVYSFELDKQNNGWELWACLNEEDKVPEIFYLFPYEAGVIYYGR